MEVKVIFVGVGVIVIWHLFSGKDNPELEDEMNDELIDRKLQDVRYSIAAFRNEWEAMKEKYFTNFDQYEKYWASGMQATRQGKGEDDEISDLLDRISKFRLQCRQDGVMKEIVDASDRVSSYQNESLDYVHRMCTIISKEIRSQTSAWNARLASPMSTEQANPPGSGLVGDADDMRLNMPFMAIEERPFHEHWTAYVEKHGSDVTHVQRKVDKRGGFSYAGEGLRFSGQVKEVLSQDEQMTEVRAAIILSKKQALASAVSDVNGR